MGLAIPKMSLADFLAWEHEQPERHEFFAGEVFAMVGGTARHNRVILNLASALAAHLEGSNCQVFTETMRLQLADEAVLYPDVMVSCGRSLAGDELSVDDPKLIIEVLSPSTRGYDKRDKFILYRTLASLREYVLIDPQTRTIESFSLQADGWLLKDQSESETLTLLSVDLQLPRERLFRGLAPSA